MTTNPLDSYERGRRAGIVEALGAMSHLFHRLDKQDIGRLYDCAREAESSPEDFDLTGLLEQSLSEQTTASADLWGEQQQ